MQFKMSLELCNPTNDICHCFKKNLFLVQRSDKNNCQ